MKNFFFFLNEGKGDWVVGWEWWGGYENNRVYISFSSLEGRPLNDGVNPCCPQDCSAYSWHGSDQMMIYNDTVGIVHHSCSWARNSSSDVAGATTRFLRYARPLLIVFNKCIISYMGITLRHPFLFCCATQKWYRPCMFSSFRFLSCIPVSINYEFSFDDAMAEYGCEVHSFDPRWVVSSQLNARLQCKCR